MLSACPSKPPEAVGRVKMCALAGRGQEVTDTEGRARPAAVPVATDVAAVPAFDQLYRSDYRRLVALAYGLSGSRTAAEELAQEAFLAAHRRWDEIGAYDDPSAWLRRVVVNRSVSLLRRRVAEGLALARLGARRELPPPYPSPTRWCGGRCARCLGARPRWSPSATSTTGRWPRSPRSSGAPRGRSKPTSTRPASRSPAPSPTR